MRGERGSVWVRSVRACVCVYWPAFLSRTGLQLTPRYNVLYGVVFDSKVRQLIVESARESRSAQEPLERQVRAPAPHRIGAIMLCKTNPCFPQEF